MSGGVVINLCQSARARGSLRKGDSYRSERKIIHKAALIRMLKALSGERNATGDVERQLEEMGVREEDEVTVCELFDQYTRQGRKEGRKEDWREGRKEGQREGRREGRREGDARRLVADIEKLMKNLHFTLEKACEVFETSVGSYEEAKKLLN